MVTTAGTVNAWNQKALRASAGSLFRVPVVGVTVEELAGLKGRGVVLMAAVAEDSRDAIEAHDAEFGQATAILIGNEGAGLSEELVKMADVRVTIACPGKVESLNAAVAGSLLLYEASRQRAAGGGIGCEGERRFPSGMTKNNSRRTNGPSQPRKLKI